MITVRGLEPRDRGPWGELWLGYQAFYEVTIPAATTRVTWRRLLDPHEPAFGAIAEEGDRPVGLVHWVFHRSTWSVNDYCYLQDLFVASDARKHGAGRALIEHVYGVARAAGCARVYWLTHESNAVAIRLYDALADRSGFIQYRQLIPEGQASGHRRRTGW